MLLTQAPSWQAVLADEFKKPYMLALDDFLVEQKKAGKVIYPPEVDRFRAFEATALDQVKVVILGQDPYHGAGQAHGLSFSVRSGVKVPPSLLNIFKELQRDLGIDLPDHGCLDAWSKQGVLLLNSVLSVEKSKAASHQKQGWEVFTDRVIATINESCSGVVFMLWGAYAQKKAVMIDQDRHCILMAAHPSPLSAHRGFIGCGHFSSANQYLLGQKKTAIDWRIISGQLGLSFD